MCIYWSLAPAGLLCACVLLGKTYVSVIEKTYVCLSMIVLPDHSHLAINLNLNTQDKNWQAPGESVYSLSEPVRKCHVSCWASTPIISTDVALCRLTGRQMWWDDGPTSNVFPSLQYISQRGLALIQKLSFVCFFINSATFWNWKYYSPKIIQLTI